MLNGIATAAHDALLAAVLLAVASCHRRDAGERTPLPPSGPGTAAAPLAAAPAGSAAVSPPVAPSVAQGGAPPGTRCPADMALVMSGVFCIQRWEAQLFYDDGRVHDPYAVPPVPSRMGRMCARSSAGVVPQGYVGRDQAQLACTNAGYRLCTSEEWRAACRGFKGRRFPYGKDFRVDGACNTHKFPDSEHLVKRFYPDAGWTTREMTDRRINQVPGGLARTGQYARCGNELGVFDMVGNLQEWVSDLAVRGQHAGHSVLLGDHYMGQGRNYEGCDATNTAHPYYPDQPARNQRDYSTGVRCCADPE